MVQGEGGSYPPTSRTYCFSILHVSLSDALTGAWSILIYFMIMWGGCRLDDLILRSNRNFLVSTPKCMIFLFVLLC